MKTFQDWVQENKGVNLDEADTCSSEVASYPRRTGGETTKMNQKPVEVGNDLKPKGKKGKKKKPKKIKDMSSDFKDLPESQS